MGSVIATPFQYCPDRGLFARLYRLTAPIIFSQPLFLAGRLFISPAPLPLNSQQTSSFLAENELMSRQNSEGEARLLVVDDEPNIRDLLASSLRFAGFEVSTAADGHSAYRQAMDESPDLIVLDVMLPDMDGFTVTRRLREAGVQIPVTWQIGRASCRERV